MPLRGCADDLSYRHLCYPRRDEQVQSYRRRHHPDFKVHRKDDPQVHWIDSQLHRYREHNRCKDKDNRSEEHTSELQSLMSISYAVFCLTKKKTTDISFVGIIRLLSSRHSHHTQTPPAEPPSNNCISSA